MYAFRRLANPADYGGKETNEVYEKVRKMNRKIPEIYRVKGLADNADWLKLLHKSVFQWPPQCSLDEKTKELIGLAKSICYLWEPGVLTNIEGALEAGASSDEITEAILVVSMVSGLAEVERVVQVASRQLNDSGIARHTGIDKRIQEIHDDALKTIGYVPDLYKTKPMLENPDWLAAIHQSAKIQFRGRILDQKTRALVCLAASAAKGWDRGIKEHSSIALRSGATAREIVDTLTSIYKTLASIGIQVGFGVPCSVPEIRGLRLLKDYYSSSKRNHRKRGRRRR